MMLWVGLGLSLPAAVGIAVTEGLGKAVQPGLGVVLLGVLLFRLHHRPPVPKVWDRRRILLFAVIFVPVTAATIGVLAWVAVVATGWPNRLIGLVGIAVVAGLATWLVMSMRQEDRIARTETTQPGTL